jgi:hypothetical protein
MPLGSKARQIMITLETDMVPIMNVNLHFALGWYSPAQKRLA